jgi:6-phosphogluconolactonase
MRTRWIQVLPDGDTAARRAADVVAGRLRAAVAAKGRFRVALSGGVTPLPMFEALAAKQLPWSQVEIYQVDERVAPLGSAQRNLTSIAAILGRTGATIVAMPVESDDLASAAVRYQDALPDAFDLVHLGLGIDGSTASLFPGDPVLRMFDRDVALSGPCQRPERMTLTYRGLSKAAEILWLITGATKAAPLGRLCVGDSSAPAARVTTVRARVVTDDAAVHVLKTHPPSGVVLWHRRDSSSSSESTGR